MSNTDIEFLGVLEKIIIERTGESAEKSYTAELLASGTQRIAQKVGEEAVELALAAVASDREAQLDETADLVYHLLVLLTDLNLSLSDVVRVLEDRHAQRAA
ncbi:MAG: phosphoribosyl-ATP diphosphatase [Woeseia sp.]|nr:phosphoribosyl-ATP diphosphatase [Woeseia sp.]MBT8097445.1 phosphoribosyl-ATP diphosphatase [Woeseia sp.]NNE59425.1 phosphoribosyl-ATP diphosphatase [Woeseia sp.]NNL53533.1 phosphoribosyl-ATP diphosphatase [Woeseia sp.]